MIALVLMPFCDVERPSLALGLLKAALTTSGFDAQVVYANLRFARQVGVHASSLPLRLWAPALVGEWIFAGAAFPDFFPADDRYLDECVAPFARFHAAGDPAPLARALVQELRRLRVAAPAFIDRLAREILASKPAIVGCSSSYAQQVASLALLRRIRELDPAVVTLLGGANVEAGMGAAVVRAFPWIDAICSGEGDDALVSFCRLVEQRGRAALAEPLPAGMATHSAPGGAAKRAAVSDLDALPLPDYDGYFAALSGFSDSERQLLRPVLPMETSRGCWWGDRRTCAFCGLNLGRRGYRFKSPERACAEWGALAAQTGVRDFALADNVMPPGYGTSLFPELERRGAPYRLFYEIRPGLRREQVRQLAAAGVRHVQAGIESLHDGLLALMDKGTDVLQNVALLKHALEFGLTVGWHLLTGFPGELDEWYGEMAAWLPQVHHLQPPASVHGITLQRFSAYLREPVRYGLNPVPYNSYGAIYPLPPETIREIAYYFRDASWPEYYPEMNRDTLGVRTLRSAVQAWTEALGGSCPAALVVRELEAGALGFVDTRDCAVSREGILRELSAHVYREICDPIEEAALPDRLARRGIAASPAAVREAVAEIVGLRLALQRSGRLLALATPALALQLPSAPDPVAAETAFHRYLGGLAARSQ